MLQLLVTERAIRCLILNLTQEKDIVCPIPTLHLLAHVAQGTMPHVWPLKSDLSQETHGMIHAPRITSIIGFDICSPNAVTWSNHQIKGENKSKQMWTELSDVVNLIMISELLPWIAHSSVEIIGRWSACLVIVTDRNS